MLPWGIRRLIYSYFDVKELYKVSQLSKMDRQILLNNEVISLERVLTRFKRNIKESDLSCLQYLINFTTKFPKKIFLDTHDFLPTLKLYDKVAEINPSKIGESRLYFRL